MGLNLLLLVVGLVICFGGIYIRKVCSREIPTAIATIRVLLKTLSRLNPVAAVWLLPSMAPMTVLRFGRFAALETINSQPLGMAAYSFVPIMLLVRQS